MKLETHASRLTTAVLNDWKEVIYDLTTDAYPSFSVCVKGVRMNMTIGDLINLMGLNILEDCSISIDTEGGFHELVIRDTFELI